MQVLCIDAAPRPSDFSGPAPEFLGTYNVVRECLGIGADGVYAACYELSEFPPYYDPSEGDYVAPLFDVDRFVVVGAVVHIGHELQNLAA